MKRIPTVIRMLGAIVFLLIGSGFPVYVWAVAGLNINSFVLGLLVGIVSLALSRYLYKRATGKDTAAMDRNVPVVALIASVLPEAILAVFVVIALIRKMFY